MELGLFTEISVPRPWGPTSERDAYHQVVDQAVLAEAAGFDSF